MYRLIIAPTIEKRKKDKKIIVPVGTVEFSTLWIERKQNDIRRVGK